MKYIGRFAPSPTGPLHYGSLLAALVSFLEARANGGKWHLRIDDLDTPRVIAGSDELIKQTLYLHGLIWDDKIVYQSQQTSAYLDALKQLKSNNYCYTCDCTRARISNTRYDGYCRNRPISNNSPTATRLITNTHVVNYQDKWQGHCAQNIEKELGDFVIWRKDGLCAYQLAVVIDDNAIGVNHVVRGIDLNDSTPRQIFLYQRLNYNLPAYGHFPVIVNKQGQKLSKQSFAEAVNNQCASQNLLKLLKSLNQEVVHTSQSTPSTIIQHAIANWQPDKLPRQNIIWENTILA